MANNTIVNVGNGRSGWQDMNQSVGMLQRAIGDMSDTKRQDDKDILNSFTRRREMALNSDTAKVLQSAEKNLSQQILSDRYDQTYNSLYDEAGNARIGSNPEETAQLQAKQAEWNSGFLGTTPGQENQKQMHNIEAFGDIQGKVLDPKGYSDRVYQGMLDMGISPADAEAERAKQAAKYAKAPMSKMQEMQMKAAVDMEMQNAELSQKAALAAHKITTSKSNGGFTVDANGNKIANSKTVSSKTYKGDYNKQNSAKLVEHLTKSGITENSWFGADANNMVDGYLHWQSDGYKNSDINRVTLSISDDSFDYNKTRTQGWGVLNQTQKFQIVLGQALEADPLAQKNKKGNGGGSSSSKTGGTMTPSTFNSFTGIRDAKGLAKETAAIQKQSKANIDSIFAGHNSPSSQSVVNAMFSGIDGITAPEKKKAKAEAKKVLDTTKKKGGSKATQKKVLGDVVAKTVKESKAILEDLDYFTSDQATLDEMNKDYSDTYAPKPNGSKAKNYKTNPKTGLDEFSYTSPYHGNKGTNDYNDKQEAFYKDKISSLDKQITKVENPKTREEAVLLAELKKEKGSYNVLASGGRTSKQFDDLKMGVNGVLDPVLNFLTKSSVDTFDRKQKVLDDNAFNDAYDKSVSNKNANNRKIIKQKRADRKAILEFERNMTGGNNQVLPPVAEPKVLPTNTGGQSAVPKEELFKAMGLISKGKMHKALPILKQAQPYEIQAIIKDLEKSDPGKAADLKIMLGL